MQPRVLAADEQEGWPEEQREGVVVVHARPARHGWPTTHSRCANDSWAQQRDARVTRRVQGVKRRGPARRDAPRGHGDRLEHILDVHHLEGQDYHVRDRPQPRVDPQPVGRALRKHECADAHDEEAGARLARGRLAAHARVVGVRRDHGHERPEDDRRLHIGDLQQLDVREDGELEDERHEQKLGRLAPHERRSVELPGGGEAADGTRGRDELQAHEAARVWEHLQHRRGQTPGRVGGLPWQSQSSRVRNDL
eukprot:3054099-Prymnesium_polylepis.1